MPEDRSEGMHFANLFSCLLLLGAASAAAAADLLEIHALAVANDPRFLAAGHQRDAALQARPIARAELLPEIVATGAYGIERNEITADDEETGREITRSGTSKPYDARIALRQVLFDGEAWARLRRADDEIEAAAATLEAARQDLMLRVARAYFEVLASRDDLRLARAENEALGRQLAEAESRLRAGIATITDVRDAEAQHDLTLATILDAERQLLASRDALAEITGESVADLAVLAKEIPLEAPEPDDREVWVERALAANPELRAVRFRAEAAEHDVEERRARHLPSVGVEAGQAVGKSSGFNTGDFDTRSVFLGVSVPLFEGLGTVAESRQTASRLSVLRAEVDAARRSAERRMRDAFRGVTTGAARVRALLRAVTSNRTALEASEAGLRVGTRTLVDVLNAQRFLYQAERDAARARYDYLLSRLELERASGGLDRERLEQVNALLVRNGEADTPP